MRMDRCWTFLNLINAKIDLAEAVGADLNVMERDARRMRHVYSLLTLKQTLYRILTCLQSWTNRDGGPTIFAEVKNGKGVDNIVGLILSGWKSSGAHEISLKKWKEGGKRNSTDV